MKLYVCMKCNRMSTSPTCCDVDNQHVFAADSLEEILGIDTSSSVTAIKEARNAKAKILAPSLNDTEPRDSRVDYEGAASLYNEAAKALCDIEEGDRHFNLIAKKYIRNHTKQLDKVINKEIRNAFLSIQGLRALQDPKDVILVLVVGAVLFGIPVGGLTVFGFTLVASSPMLFEPTGMGIMAAVLITTAVVNLYRLLKKHLGPIKSEVGDQIRVFVQYAILRVVLTQGEEAGKASLETKVEQEVATMVGAFRLHLMRVLKNWIKIDFSTKKVFSVDEGKFSKDAFLRKFHDFTELLNDSTFHKHLNLKHNSSLNLQKL